MDPETHKFSVSQDVVYVEVSSHYKAEGAIIESTDGDTSVHTAIYKNQFTIVA